jgi:hypothetical protein
MQCTQIHYSGHALRQMFARGISTAEVRELIAQGKTIVEYSDDTPYPSFLLLAFVDQRALHGVIAKNPDDGSCIVVTVYEPDPALWSDDFESRRDP